MIIDCHCHAGLGDGLTGPWDTAAPLSRHLRRAARAGIRRTVIFAAFHSDYGVANRDVARMVASRPDRLYGFAFVHAERDRGRVHELVRVAVQEYGFMGIKLHRHDARITRGRTGHPLARARFIPGRSVRDAAGSRTAAEQVEQTRSVSALSVEIRDRSIPCRSVSATPELSVLIRGRP